MEEMLLKTPCSVAELVTALKGADTNTYLISGGTDLIIKLRKNRIYSGTMIDMKGIRSLEYIREEAGFVKLGANTTFIHIINSPVLQQYAACLVEAAGQIGSTQIRNVATVGGNIGNAFAGADCIPALMAMDAKVEVICSKGESYIKDIADIVIGSGKNSLKKDEAIIEIAFPIQGNRCRTAFGKIGSRSRVTIAKINMAAFIKLDETEERIEEARIFLGALGPKAFRSRIVEEALVGRTVSLELIHSFAEALTAQVDSAIAGRSSQEYKREAIRGLADEVFYKLFGDLLQEVK
ncbi:FAD binding domain-containing protein [Geosporobacter ferrireducens]|uniref:FAD-binding PCMH-type domain-containing protein n=1 Tax=Geosporobacter ferrireducens TaxID=1424294 RepID=A0A1D8GCM2_9FIRM|nr:FAD binding domain-containing protein [Geosporobacter ferrireducens]AOT68648.1 hypothetical protein Gferi_02970 [Geosporobacter ferrireducens]